MKIFADFHIHSHYSRATSGQMNIKELSYYAKRKGLNLLGTGDFSHPLWFKELKSILEPAGEGTYSYNGMNFVLSNEISLIYSHGGKGRKVHLLMISPDFDTVSQITEFLLSRGRVDYDGRPIFGMSCPEFVERIMEISDKNFIIPAHIWTPYFGLFGSMSGFDSVKECFQEQEKHIHALETGLSSDPPMNWRLSQLDKYALVSNSDSHSPWPSRIGRECNAFEMKEISYNGITKAIKEKDPSKFLYTIEVDPSYGKYHYDGHRDCHFSSSPEETKKLKGICPVCKKPLTIGVLNRAEELADRPEGFVPKNSIPFKRLLPLAEIISSIEGSAPLSKKVVAKESAFIEKFGSELNVLLDASEVELKKVDESIADIIMKNRSGDISIEPGYDGEYGKPLLGKKLQIKNQKSLSDF